MPGDAPSISMTAGICGRRSGIMFHVIEQSEKVLILPRSASSTQSSVGRKQSSQNIRGGIIVRRHPRHVRPRSFPRFSPSR